MDSECPVDPVFVSGWILSLYQYGWNEVETATLHRPQIPLLKAFLILESCLISWSYLRLCLVCDGCSVDSRL